MDLLPETASPRHATDQTESLSPTVMQKRSFQESPDQQGVPDNGAPDSPRTISAYVRKR
ncbi:hypothetical protein PENSOL_c045G07935 [Penicillium solitum]|uniref:Uncharacterized protein n=1 Tax=Penicillium solitum TaxID=60172 RepID=A0A1V6QSB6_9EURO|nr:uncharacterized protein PENSOL_c045G07935 [Penicillium solitum]OQD92071.1 hypothetical protein PENSOL_c045G07935 [Penicillium solitum]